MFTDILPWIGYCASLIVVLSMMMHSVVKFRWINLFGALLFSTYGFLIGAIPVGILNGIIVLVDIYYLVLIYNKKEEFELLEINANSKYLPLFLKFHQESIEKYCPGFSYQPSENTVSFFVLRNMSIAGLFIAHRENETILNVELDYVLPEYKDFKNGKYVYFTLRGKFLEAGFKTVKAAANNQSYFKYLKKFGFTETNNGMFTMQL
jgi:hypothetical protein